MLVKLEGVRNPSATGPKAHLEEKGKIVCDHIASLSIFTEDSTAVMDK